MTEFESVDGVPARLLDPKTMFPTVSTRAKVALLDEIKVQVSVSLGEVTLSARELLGLEPGALVTLDTALDQEVNVLLNGKVVAQGTIVAIGEHYGIRVSQTFYSP